MAKKKIKSKRKLSNKEIAAKLRKAKLSEKSLKEHKKEPDKKFRREAKKEALLPITDLNAEVRLHTKQSKASKSEIESQKNKIKFIEKENKKLSSKRNKLEKRYKKAKPSEKRDITKQLKSPEYQKKDVDKEKNLLNYLEGKDFDYIINDGFRRFKVNTKELKKVWKKGDDISLPILKEMEKDTQEAIKHYQKLIDKEKKTASKARMKKLNRIKKGLQDKLEHVISQNIKAVETGNMKELDEYNDKGEKAYSLLFKVVGFNIDRIGV